MKQLRHIDWARAAVRVAELIPLSSLHPQVLAWADTRTRAAKGPWAVAFSGGADSLALLLLAWAHWPARREKLIALHFDHCLRGAESRADAAFCRKVCHSLGVRFEVGSWKRTRSAPVSEAAARSARMVFFDEALSAARAKALLLGHQMDDVAETFLMRLARGSGTAGLSAPRPVQAMPNGRVHLRPLLTLKKSELCEILMAAGVSWREDSSNAGPVYLRNRVRNLVLPAWLDASPGRDALAGASLARELLQEDDDALESWLDSIKALRRGAVLDLGVLQGKPNALWRRALRRWLAATPYRGDLSRQGFEALLAAVISARNTRQSLGREGFALIRGGLLRYQRNRTPRLAK